MSDSHSVIISFQLSAKVKRRPAKRVGVWRKEGMIPLQILKKLKEIVQKNSIYYLIGVLTLLFLKLFYAKASCADLRWILAPTAHLVTLVTGISFSYDPVMGYANHSLRYVIAPSCSGVRFLMILIAMLLFSFVHRTGKKLRFTFSVMPISYALTVFVNVLRIVLSIYLPLFLEQKSFYVSCLSQDTLHTAIGTAVYFVSLLVIYRLSDTVFIQPEADKKENRNASYLVPAFWYFAIILGIPFLNRAFAKNGGKFTEYAALLFAVCLPVLFVFQAMHFFREARKRQPK